MKDQQGGERRYKIRPNVSLGKLMSEYVNNLGLRESEVRFMVDGDRISADDTAEKLGLEEGGMIDCCMEQTGGY